MIVESNGDLILDAGAIKAVVRIIFFSVNAAVVDDEFEGIVH